MAIGYQFIACNTEAPEPEGIIELFKLNVDNTGQGVSINPFVLIDKTGQVTIMAHRPDMGQGTHQIVPLLIAEELNMPLDQVVIKQARGEKQYGRQGVGGSASVRTMWEPMRKVGAAAREMLEQAAAQHWNVSPADVYAENGSMVNRATQERIGFGDVVEAASELEVPEAPQLKAAKDFRLIGKSIPRPAIALKVSGAANFGIDMKIEGMVYALIERSPTFSATIQSIDDSAAKLVAGVQQILRTQRNLGKNIFEGVAVIADSYWAALQGRKALKVEWEEDKELRSTDSIFKEMRDLANTNGT